ncbi:MAG: NAD(P)/FAD-dependent oxidoreductase [Lachnospiraceae bacterium]|nr:NAD(P)/FAD-dependent oxidoreductase [Lachnospiraceae bacterium]
MRKNVIVLGAGPAGMTAAIKAAENGARVLLLEHMDRVGKKILSTGNGKCNITNEYMEVSCFHSSQPEFCLKALSRFGKKAALNYMEEIGIMPISKRGYYYPASEQATAVLDALRRKCEAAGVETRTGIKVQKIEKKKRFQLTTSESIFEADALILATGSMAAPKTGSDGSGYELAKSLGHRIIRPLPALVQLKSSPNIFKQLAGLRMDAKLELLCDGKKIEEETGELQCVDYGISGIPVFQLSSRAIRLFEDGHKMEMVIDFFPALDGQALFETLIARRKRLSYLDCEEFLTGMFAKAAAGVFLRSVHIPLHARCTDVKEEDWRRFSKLVKRFHVPINGYNSFDRAQTCSGGVDPSQVYPQTMESKLVPGLYFAGEMLDVDGICGGYNLQWAWTSGTLAGIAAAKTEARR